MGLRLAIDFDNTVAVSQGPDPEPGPMVPEADTYIQRLYDEGHEIVIWSARANTEINSAQHREECLVAMAKFLKRHKIPYHEIDYGDQGKVLADVYVDDRSVGAPLIDFMDKKVIDWHSAFQLIRLIHLSKRVVECGRSHWAGQRRKVQVPFF